MTSLPKPAALASSLTATYDSWNRLVEVKDGETVIQKNEYDGLNRRTKKHFDSEAARYSFGIDTYQHFNYTASWQNLETRKADLEETEPETLAYQYHYVWSGRYIDSPVLNFSLCQAQ